MINIPYNERYTKNEKGILIMKKTIIANEVCSITKKVVENFNKLTDKEFKALYQCSKRRYYKRFMKYGDPYMNAPLAKIGKFLNRMYK